MKKLVAIVMLGLYIMRHFVLLFGAIVSGKQRRHAGYAQFMDNYRDDGIVALLPEEVADFGQMQRCIRCGLCDSLCANTRLLSEAGFHSLSLLASTHSRGLTGAPLADELIARFDNCENCAACFDICPTQVPIRRIVDQLKRISAERARQQRAS